MSKFRCFSLFLIRAVKGARKKQSFSRLVLGSDLVYRVVRFAFVQTSVGAIGSVAAPTFPTTSVTACLELNHDETVLTLPRDRRRVPDTDTAVPKPKGEGASFMAADFVSADYTSGKLIVILYGHLT